VYGGKGGRTDGVPHLNRRLKSRKEGTILPLVRRGRGKKEAKRPWKREGERAPVFAQSPRRKRRKEGGEETPPTPPRKKKLKKRKGREGETYTLGDAGEQGRRGEKERRDQDILAQASQKGDFQEGGEGDRVWFSGGWR